MSVAGSAKSKTTSMAQPPPPPSDIPFPPGYKARRCVRCGTWSTQPSPYPLANSPERAWGSLIPWESGTLTNPGGRHCLLCRKVRFGNVTAMDKELDRDTSQSHLFLAQRARLVEKKILNPAFRIQSAADLGGSERIAVQETKKQGLKAPKKKFMLLRTFKRKYPNKTVNPNAIITKVIDGEKHEGVDVVDSEDEGVFEYLDETFTEVVRSNTLSSETILSEDQNDRLHAATLKTMNKFADDTNAIQVSSSAARSSGRNQEVPVTEKTDENEDAGNDGDEDDEHDSHLLDPSPFARLFGRIKTTSGAAPAVPKRAAPKAAAEPASKKAKTSAAAKAAPSAPSGAERNKRRAPAEESEGSFGAKAPVPAAQDDSDIVASYQAQVDELQKLDADGSADPKFIPWCKVRLAALSELKQGITSKRKSLNRRKNGSEGLGDALEHLMKQITLTQDFLKKASAGTAASEGRVIYDKLMDYKGAGTEVSKAFWERALKAVAFEDLKLAQWNILFDDTYGKCKSHLGDAGHVFFGLLTSQIAQKLVKSVGGGNKPGPEHVKFLLGFVTEMLEKIQTVSPEGGGKEASDSDDLKVVSGVKTILDWKSPPDDVLSSHEMFDKSCPVFEHWLIQALLLDRGRRVIDSAVANAKSREVQAGVLSRMAKAAAILDKFGLLDEEVLKSENAKASFTREYGQEVAKAEKVLQDPGAKSLKGADKEVLTDLAGRVRAAGLVVVKACFAFEITPFFEEFFMSIEKRQQPQCQLLDGGSCILQMKAVVDPKLMSAIDTLGKFLHSFVPKLQEALAGRLEAAKSQEALLEWNKNIEGFLTSTKVAGFNYAEFDGLAKKVQEAVSPLLKGQVNKEICEQLAMCIKIFEDTCEEASKDDPTPFKPEVGTKFEDALRQARALSSVLGDLGGTVREGLLVVEAVTGFFLAFCTDKASPEPEAPEKLRKQDFHILSIWLSLEKEATDPAKHVKKIRALLDVLAAHTGVKLTEEEWGRMGSLFRSSIEECYKAVKGVISEMRKDFGDQLQHEQKKMGDLALPSALASASELKEVLELQSVVAETFSLDISKKVADAAVSIEKWLQAVKVTSKKLKVAPCEICDESAGTSAWRACLLWMTVGNLCSTLCSKAAVRAVNAKTQPSEKVISAVKEAMAVASEHTLEIPAGLQAVATQPHSSARQSRAGDSCRRSLIQ